MAKHLIEQNGKSTKDYGKNCEIKAILITKAPSKHITIVQCR